MSIEMLLQNGAAISVPTSLIANTLATDVNLFMDASNEGLAVLYPAARQFIRCRYDAEELHSGTSTCADTGVTSVPDMPFIGACHNTTPNSNPYSSLCS
ncbi:hypothetical protein JG688_00018348 [Phytophthora aleatoria]|uniref:Uncharacterized protein n=1 Tax=Phytophthora aleatoria TaxID=2496075 RepID=A0A8J5IPK7_9STRA|nr:hypothetical protein JG688_00018348 [Phytophthora aleatoria]